MEPNRQKAEANLLNLLVVDDERSIREGCRDVAQGIGYTTHIAENAEHAFRVLDTTSVDVVLLDLRLPGLGGIEILKEVKRRRPETVVVVMTGYASVETAVQALKHGAYDYITKPVDPDELSHLVAKALEHRRARREVARLRENLQEVFPSTELIGKSPAMKSVVEHIEMVAPTDATVLITGESGTGKEVVARAIHAASPRRYMPMVTIHCGALTETLLESELFGHERGAFTGAQYRKKGKFEVADGGTVFLDEISDISLKTQSDLLRVLQEKEIVRVGGNQPIKVDFRCIAATNKNLEGLVKAGTFRPDLYYRLHVFCIELPALRERREDVPLLVTHFLNKFCMATSRSVPQVAPDAMEQLMRHEWPGNVRELENAVERALVVCRGPEIRAADFSFQFEAEPMPAGRTLDDVERSHIERILRETEGNLSRAARILDIDRTTLYNKLRRYGLK
jgi:DNA-binding NtrC family response regulator